MKRLTVIFISLIIFVLFVAAVNKPAAAANNPIYATISFVQEKIDGLLALLEPRITQNGSDIELLSQRIADLEDKSLELENKVSELETKALPTGKWVHVCFDVATANLFVMKGGTCFPHVHWKVFVQCYPGTPCLPDNPADSYYVPPQEQ